LLDAPALQKALQSDGKVALYGVYFDTDKATLKPESKAQLDQMAQLLKTAPALKVFIVGHTDNQGQFAHNQELSQQRADAVVKALSSQYGIAAGRLSGKGVASLAPVASNDAEPGRAKNRRVELVLQ
jgi:OOP family OmpA-OmpF porin